MMKDNEDELNSNDRATELPDEPEPNTENGSTVENKPEPEERRTGAIDSSSESFEEEPEERMRGSIGPSDDFSKEEPEERTTGGIGPSVYSIDPEPDDNEEMTRAEYPDDDGEEGLKITEYDEEPEKKPKKKFTSDVSSTTLKATISGMLSFFTIWKRDVGQTEIDAMEENFHYAPVVGAVFSVVLAMEMLILFLLNYYFNLPLGPIVAIVVLATVMLGSKFLHFDGLVDFGDGIVASGDQDKHITAMKDSNIGAGGLGLAIIVTLATFAIYSVTFNWGDPIFYALFFIIPATEILVKNSMVCAAANGTPGDGMASRQVRKADSDTMFRSTFVSAVLLILGLVITTAVIWVMNEVHLIYWALPLLNNFAFYAIAMFIAVVFGLIVSVIVGIMMSKLADRTFGSTSGDILGATNEIARPIVALSMFIFFLIFMRVLL